MALIILSCAVFLLATVSLRLIHQVGKQGGEIEALKRDAAELRRMVWGVRD